jgi:hypothetical protein
VLDKPYDRLRIGDAPQIILIDFRRDTIYFNDSKKALEIADEFEINSYGAHYPRMTPKLLSDIFSAKVMFKRTRHVVFSSGFLDNFDLAEHNRELVALWNKFVKVRELKVVPAREWNKAKKEFSRFNAVNTRFVEIEETIGTGEYHGQHYGIRGLNLPVRVMKVEVTKTTSFQQDKKASANKSLPQFLRRFFSRRARKTRQIETADTVNARAFRSFD